MIGSVCRTLFQIPIVSKLVIAGKKRPKFQINCLPNYLFFLNNFVRQLFIFHRNTKLLWQIPRAVQALRQDISRQVHARGRSDGKKTAFGARKKQDFGYVCRDKGGKQTEKPSTVSPPGDGGLSKV